MTRPRSVRVPDHIWDAARARAQAEGTTVTAVILSALTRYAKGAPARPADSLRTARASSQVGG